MSDPIVVHLKQAFLNAPGFWESTLSEKSGNWGKKVEDLDKTQTDGYSILGDFISDIDCVATHEPGLYLYCEKKGRRKGQENRLYTLFVLEAHGEVRVLREVKTASKDWAIELWPEIEAHFAVCNSAVEQRRQQLLSEIETLEFQLKQKRAQLLAIEMRES
ncbi:hypothetical protein [Oxynema aestuarii]|jgi:hypothetical protein|uniref:Uncharacterized protein n=1 Tax=Oxynema aestuarii AP17 TaxID=2064643 RepID=A0A6H1U466_9CYAN|nr:hypothetical protein [Oxynema aestuarii]QIZ72823.1 hypothetical protein HCG48_21305 [Oxynema aestuarii AP17]RMH72329.1 MAG: hypothetical protein D6680_19445 [Cyanobacteria bacterium J007]